jgi:hypothetical protein
MATRQQAERELARLGFQLDPDSGKSETLGWWATIDPVGHMSIGGECKGRPVANFTATASEFWDEVISEAREIAPLLTPCPCVTDGCEYHAGEVSHV